MLDLFGNERPEPTPNRFGPKLNGGAEDLFSAWPEHERRQVLDNMVEWALVSLLPDLESAFTAYRSERASDERAYFAKLVAPRTADEREWAQQLFDDIGCVVSRNPLFLAAMADQRGSVDDYIDLVCIAFPREVAMWECQAKGGELFAQ